MSVDVLGDEKGSLENVKDVLGGGRRRVRSSARGGRLDLVKEHVCGLRVVDVANAIRCDLFASVWEVSVEVDVVMDNAGVG